MKKRLVCLLMVFSTSTLYASALKNLSSLLMQVKSAKADFKQTVTSAGGQVLQSASGQMLLLKPGYFSWVITQPSEQRIIIRSGKVYLYQKDLQQLTVKPFNLNATQTPATLLLNGNFSVLNEQYTATEKQANGGVIFSLLPKDNHQLLEKVTLSFAGKQLRTLSLFDHFNRITNITFQHFQLNPGLSKSAFDFSIPKGTDVIHE